MKDWIQFTAETPRETQRGRREKLKPLRHLCAPLCISAAVSRVLSRQRLFSSTTIFSHACLWLITISLCLQFAGRAAAQAELEVELVAVGDVLLDRGVARAIERSRGTSVVFKEVRGILASADLAFGNLESPVTTRCERRRPQAIAFRAEPRYLRALTDAGFDVLSLANNHSLDCGPTGLIEIMRRLRRVGLRWCGAGATRAEAEAPAILNVKGIRIAFVGFTAIAPEGGRSMKNSGPGVALASPERLERAVTAARLEADIVVASLHWGTEYASRPGREQLELARVAVQAGASLIIGHHTHTLEGMEVIEMGGRRALVAYSLGNFAFDSPRAIGKRVVESIVLRCRFNRSGLVSAEIVPVILENYLPRPARAREADAILARLTALSAELKTRIQHGRVDLGN